MKYLLFGTGDYYQRYKKWFDKEDIVALLDNSTKKIDTYIDGIKVVSPEDGVKLVYDKIIILSFYVKSMKSQLISLGVDENKILHFYDMHDLFLNDKKIQKKYILNKEVYVYKEFPSTEKRILLLSQELTFGGPTLALFQMAIHLKEFGYEVIVASMIDGPLRGKFEEENIAVIIDNNLQIATMQEIDWIKGFSLIVCNTINFHVFLMERDEDVPVIWWLHDAPFFYEGVRKNNLKKINFKNLKVVSVGPIPGTALKKYLPQVSTNELLYEVEDKHQERNLSIDKLRIVTIGFFEDIKGQDVLLSAIELFTDEERSTIEVIFVGHNDTLFGDQLKSKYKDCKEITFKGVIGRNEIHSLLEETDVLICPSRQDSMPTVVAEAMMHAIPSIVSDAIGTAAYIEDGINGMIFENENVEALYRKIKFCIANRTKMRDMGLHARKVYEEKFSVEAFENNIQSIIEETY